MKRRASRAARNVKGPASRRSPSGLKGCWRQRLGMAGDSHAVTCRQMIVIAGVIVRLTDLNVQGPKL